MNFHPFILFLFVLALLPVIVFSQTPRLYGKQIYLAGDASKAAQESAKALAQWLGKMTGSDFTIVDKPGKQGIFLVLDTSTVASALVVQETRRVSMRDRRSRRPARSLRR